MGRYRKGYKPMFQTNLWKIVTGDRVQVMSGRDKGRIGVVREVIRDQQWPRVVVEGVNMVKRHVKATKDTPAGSISLEGPIHYSNVQLVDPQTHAPVRVRWRFTETGERVRQLCGGLASGMILPKPAFSRRRPRLPSNSPMDTAEDVAKTVTHTPGALPSALDLMVPKEFAARTRLVEARKPRQGQQIRSFASDALGL